MQQIHPGFLWHPDCLPASASCRSHYTEVRADLALREPGDLRDPAHAVLGQGRVVAGAGGARGGGGGRAWAKAPKEKNVQKNKTRNK